jgi:CRISPR-associated exonuclease Cas4
MSGLLWVALALLVGGMALLWTSGLLRRGTGIPAGRVVYSDTQAWRMCPDALYSAAHNLRGKPDYLVQKLRYVIPVEVKSSRSPDEPYRSHILQMAAYCLLVEQEYGRRPPYGLIHYEDRTFAVDYTRELEEELLDVIAWMREDLRDGRADRNHNDVARCQACSYSVYCDQRLV